MKRKTVVFINSIPADTFGGGEKWFYQMAKALHQRGYRIALVARPGSKIMEKFRTFDYIPYELKFGGDFNPISICKLVAFFKKIQANYLMLNFNKDVSIAGIAGRLIGVEKIIFRNGFPLIHKKLKHRILMPFYDVLLSNSQALVNHYQVYGWGLEKKMTVIYNGIEVDDNGQKTFQKTPNEPFIIFGAGRLTALKRYDVFIDIIAKLKKDCSIHGIIAGGGPELDHLKKQSESIGAAIEFVGHVASIVPYLKKADIFLHPSRNEGIPNVLLEAMASSVPVVATNAGGIGELVTDNLNGFLCEIDDIDGLYEKTKSLLYDENLRKKLALAAQETIKTRFTLERMIEQVESLLLSN